MIYDYIQNFFIHNESQNCLRRTASKMLNEIAGKFKLQIEILYYQLYILRIVRCRIFIMASISFRNQNVLSIKSIVLKDPI